MKEKKYLAVERSNFSCILCGSSKYSLLHSKDNWQVYKCENCGLGVLDPHPGKDELNRLYTEDYFQSQYQEELALNSAKMKQRLRQEDHRLRFFYKFKKSGKVLDIGCGRGYFLLACRKRGYEVEGIDISADASIYVSKELKIPVHLGDAGSINLPEKSFDVITMWHSLEHAVDPNVYMQSTCRWLKDDGLLVVDVPNYASHDAIKTWNNWVGWQIPYHFYHFTKSSLFLLLNKHGFSVIRQKHYLSEYLKQKLENAFLPSFVARIIARFYSGHSFAVIAKKYI